MKIEKVNEHQIRCTLTKADLATRDLKISELAYGTEKAKDLFRDMMQQASLKFGFEAEDIPLMIEAIPLNSDCIILIITKVEDPEELDTRFSKFAPTIHEDDDLGNALSAIDDSTDDVLDLFKKIQSNNKEDAPSLSGAVDMTKDVTSDDCDTEHEDYFTITKIFSFSSINAITRVAKLLSPIYDDDNSLYKDNINDRYLLVICNTERTPETFNKVCNLLSEYGRSEKSVPSGQAFLEEHKEVILRNHAIQSLAKIN